SVYDVNSVQLIAIAKRMNEGFNHAGKSLSSATQFAAAIGFPFWIAFAWFYELTPEGLKRESEIDPDEATAPSKRRKTRSKSSLRARRLVNNNALSTGLEGSQLVCGHRGWA